MVSTRNAAGSSQATASTARPTESGLVGFWYFSTCFSNSIFFLSDPWFEFRNDNGSVPISLKELEFIHYYALKFLAERKSWTVGSAGLLARDLACSQFLETASI
jgi:hypothetical protein